MLVGGACYEGGGDKIGTNCRHVMKTTGMSCRAINSQQIDTNGHVMKAMGMSCRATNSQQIDKMGMKCRRQI